MAAEDDDVPTEFTGLVAQALRGFDNVPRSEIARAADIYDFHTIEAELAELVFDSTTQAAEAGMRSGDASAIMLTFEAAGHRIEVELERGKGPTATLTGQVVPAAAGTASAEGPGQQVTAEIDEIGRFVTTVGPGPLQLRIVLSDGTTIITDSFIV